jgi:hypothetical protein
VCVREGSLPLNHEQTHVHKLNIAHIVLFNERIPSFLVMVLEVNGFHVIFYLNDVLVATRCSYILLNLFET